MTKDAFLNKYNDWFKEHCGTEWYGLGVSFNQAEFNAFLSQIYNDLKEEKS